MRHRETCAGLTPGWVDLPEAVASPEKVIGGILDLSARIDDSVCENGSVYARLTAAGTNTGRSYGTNTFDYVRIEDGGIAERVQQSGTLSQLRQMYSGAAGLLGAATPFALGRPERGKGRTRGRG